MEITTSEYYSIQNRNYAKGNSIEKWYPNFRLKTKRINFEWDKEQQLLIPVIRDVSIIGMPSIKKLSSTFTTKIKEEKKYWERSSFSFIDETGIEDFLDLVNHVRVFSTFLDKISMFKKDNWVGDIKLIATPFVLIFGNQNRITIDRSSLGNSSVRQKLAELNKSSNFVKKDDRKQLLVSIAAINPKGISELLEFSCSSICLRHNGLCHSKISDYFRDIQIEHKSYTRVPLSIDTITCIIGEINENKDYHELLLECINTIILDWIEKKNFLATLSLGDVRIRLNSIEDYYLRPLPYKFGPCPIYKMEQLPKDIFQGYTLSLHASMNNVVRVSRREYSYSRYWRQDNMHDGWDGVVFKTEYYTEILLGSHSEAINFIKQFQCGEQTNTQSESSSNKFSDNDRLISEVFYVTWREEEYSDEVWVDNDTYFSEYYHK